jgi:hypothetical protein
MALVLADRVKEITTSTGTAAITVAGAAVGYQTFLAAIGNANTTYYTIADQSGANWEVGVGTYTSSGNTLSRDTVLASSNSGALVVFLTGTKDVFVTYPSERALYNGSTGTAPTLNNPTVTDYVESVVAVGVVSSSATIALTNGTVQTVTLTASTACTFTMPTVAAGKSFVLLLKQAATTGAGTASFTSVKWGISGAPIITSTAAKMDILSFVSDGVNWYGSISQGYTP